MTDDAFDDLLTWLGEILRPAIEALATGEILRLTIEDLAMRACVDGDAT